MACFGLDSGQKISVILYKGGSYVEATALNEYLTSMKNSGKSVPLHGSDFSINISSVKLTRSPSTRRQNVKLYSLDGKSIPVHDIEYTVELKGELI